MDIACSQEGTPYAFSFQAGNAIVNHYNFYAAQAKQQLTLDPLETHEYLPISGDPLFIYHAQRLTFGAAASGRNLHGSPRIVSIQTVSGTGANHIGARFLTEALRPRIVWISSPSWANHTVIWQMLQPIALDRDRQLRIRYYPYYSESNHSLDFKNMMGVLEAEANADDVLILQACGHNPSGRDLSRDQWKVVADLCLRKQVFPFFDLAYQGFASGSIDDDVWAVRYFLEQRIEMCVAQSFSKNMGLYGERVGAFHLATLSEDVAGQSLTKLIHIQRGETSSPPAFGAKVARIVMSDPTIYEKWQQDMREMISRLRRMRLALWEELRQLQTPGSWDHLLDECGMFSCTGLDSNQVDLLQKQFHVFMLKSGRISLSGLNEGNISYVARAIDAVVRDRTGEVDSMLI
ncbi:hypothetical protein BBP40_008395 [Aspergillus hancockii]|nr:hypothetical protein BBP40_008395 [Aspergillus hancockii]